MGKQRHTESDIQKAFFRAVAYSPWVGRIWATPNGGLRNKITAATMKAEGVLAGVWDVFVAIPAHGYHGMFIEFKRPPQSSARTRLTDQQLAFAERMGHDYRMEVHTDAAEAFAAVKDYLEGVF